MGTCWDDFPHDHARSRAYRWGEDGLLGICDSKGLVCFAPTLWNGKDPILKERLFGLSGPEGNHGEDVKECYYYLHSSPTHSYMKALYKYPQAEFPYARLVEENRARGRTQGEFELLDTGVFNDNRYFDVFVEYAKAAPDDILIRFTVVNRGPDEAPLHLLPTLWLKNTWAWGRHGEHDWPRSPITPKGKGLTLTHPALGPLFLKAERDGGEILFTENETNFERVFNSPSPSPYVKDAFHDYVIHGKKEALCPGQGTKAAFHFTLSIPAGGQEVLRLRLSKDDQAAPFGAAFDQVFADRLKESEAYFDLKIAPGMEPAARQVASQASAGLLWSKCSTLLLRQTMAGGRSVPTAGGRRPQKGTQLGLGALRRGGYFFHARQLGISLVRVLGPGFPHDPLRQARPLLRQAPVGALAS